MMTAEATVNLWKMFTGITLDPIQQDKLMSLMEEIHKSGYCMGFSDANTGAVHKFEDTQTIMQKEQEQTAETLKIEAAGLDVVSPCDSCGVIGGDHREWCGLWDPQAENTNEGV